LQRQNEEIKLKSEADQAHLEEERKESLKKAEEDLRLLREEMLKERDTSDKGRGYTSSVGRSPSSTRATAKSE